MSVVSREVMIDAPVEEVFDYALNIERMPEWWSSLVENRTPKAHAEPGLHYEWTYKMMGIRFDGEADVIEVVPNERGIIKTHGGIPSTIRHEFHDEGGKTRYTLSVDYKVPAKLGGNIADRLFVERFNEREADHIVENIKTICEAHHN